MITKIVPTFEEGMVRLGRQGFPSFLYNFQALKIFFIYLYVDVST